ncbi:MAG: hypothetical protein ACRDNZ_17510 [Streptosporangiaceae bacterium]
MRKVSARHAGVLGTRRASCTQADFTEMVEMAKYRLTFLTGLVTGFVLGTRAGRECYDQMVKAGKAVAEHPAVQQAAGAVQAQATGLAAAAGTKISDEVRERVPQLARTTKDKVSEHVPGGRRGQDRAGHGRGQRHAGNGSGDLGDGRGFSAMSDRDRNTRD